MRASERRGYRLRRLSFAAGFAIALAACDGGTVRAPTASPTATRHAPASPTAAAAPAPTRSAAPSATAPPRATQVTDPAGDVLDPEGDPPPDGTAADLRQVQVERDAVGSLTVTFEVAGVVPPSAGSLLWSVHLDGARGYTVGAQLTGGELNAGIYDRRRDVQHALEDVEVDGATITVHVPAAELEELGPTFDWSALTQLDGAYEDRTETTAFPAMAG